MSSKGKKKDLGFSTRAVHVGNESDALTGSISPPIHLTSTYEQDAVGETRGFDYSRVDNPTRQRLEENLSSLEGGKFGITFATGMAATTALFQLFDQGDHILISRNTYGGTYRMSMEVMRRQGIEFDWVDTRDIDSVASAIKKNTKLIHVETPTNPLLELCDLKAMASLCKKHKILFSVDNTFMSSYGQRPLELGADIVMHSTTKSLAGHSDILGGVLITNDELLAEKLHFMQKATGAVPSPFDCWIVLRSTKTLALRYQKASDTANELAWWLAKQKKLKHVVYPGLKNHPQYDLAVRQQMTPDGTPIFGNMISFDIGSESARDRFIAKLELFKLAESLGGVESLICSPFSMTHAALPEKDKLAMGITPSLIRLSIGIEDTEDLKKDLQKALQQ
ncbi:MAG: PLP-dependent aspartate aminotransferase family protein [Candidatus Marinimicrobia bacterium]|jgi:cystathionine beta-lyase/cystathionine gamma-synthase|nr:PLP-dependent aspartate aminotransferase family protein [Candidatus Neomarinimicrobiota bacterium]MDP6789524.1 PLP-dependent aspartate aminotransferase family protein [Candidatus Neomarinimicrobiota bacterium]MDP7072430.1 PLP-dependent aspartate aminotransferase family protein [Candidatus Neomarinimicrobiota bacterium]